MNFDKLIFGGGVDNDDAETSDLFPLFSQQEEKESNKLVVPESLPILPIRNTVLFPGVVFPITVGRDKSIKLIKDANKSDKIIGVFAQIDPDTEEPTISQLNSIGTMAQIVKVLRMPDGNTTVIIQGKKRILLGEEISSDPYLRAKVSSLDYIDEKPDKELKALISNIKDTASENIHLSPNIPTEANFAIKNIDSDNFLVSFIASNLNISLQEKQLIINTNTLKARAHIVFEHLIREIFEKEFSANGGEVKITQASRDGGVDAVVFDPDPIRGGKIIIQAKRYTNTGTVKILPPLPISPKEIPIKIDAM